MAELHFTIDQECRFLHHNFCLGELYLEMCGKVWYVMAQRVKL
jgi:hypothetical protein